MPATVEVRFKGNRKDYFLWPDDAEPLRLWDPVIVQVERGLDFGRVSATGEKATTKCATSCGTCPSGETPPAIRPVVRRASRDEIRAADELRRTEEDTRREVAAKVRDRGLEMKVSDAEWQWDRKRLTVYFTAEKRVDFRELVRDLASTLHARIDLRQIGARDEAARLGGVGRCGKEYCCSSWLTTLSPVSLALAKDQHLSLNPAHISGGCGRLLCCLKYEHEFYVEARRRFPKEGKALLTGRGTERVIAVDIFRERVFLRHEDEGPRIVSLAELRDELDRLGEPPPEHRGPRPSIAHAAPKPAGPAPPPVRERASGRHPARARDVGTASGVTPAKPIRDVPPGPMPDPTQAEPLPAPRTVPAPTGILSQPRVPLSPDAEPQGPAALPDGTPAQGSGDRKRRRRRRRGRRGDGPPEPRPPES